MKWISVKDYLPEIGKTVIVRGGLAYRIEEEWISQTAGSSGRTIQWPISHWMEFPEWIYD